MKGQKGYAIVAAFPRLSLGIPAGVRALLRRVRRWHELAAQRQQLARFSDVALKDLGLSRADIQQETERPFWNDPLARK
ncbi:MAG: DUF1127 domain-containing protein [Pseudomonadota bacterium]